MKKMILFLGLAMANMTAFCQKNNIPDYSGHLMIGADIGKNDTGVTEKSLAIKVEGVYGWFFYQFKRMQPFKSHGNPGIEKLTMASVGYGRNSNINEGTLITWGLGLNATFTPDTGFSKKNLVFWGGTAYGNVVSENSGLEAEVSLTYAFLPKNRESDWGKNIFLPEVKLKKFFGFGKVRAGVGAEYKLRLYSENEPQRQNVVYNGISINESKSELAGLLCLDIKGFGIEAGPLFTTTKFQIKDKTGANVFDRITWPTRYEFRLLYNFAYRK